MKLILSLFLLFVISFNLIESQNVYYTRQSNDTMFITFSGSFDKVVVSKNPSIPSLGIMNDYSKSSFSIYNGSLLYDLSNLVLNSNTTNPYKANLKYQVDNLNYITYFNLFGSLDYCHTFPNSNKSTVYQSCINRESDNVFSQAGGLSKEIVYNVSNYGLVAINYQSTDFSYGCYRNTWFNIKCNENVDFSVTRMTVDTPCNYKIFIDSKSACPVNTEIPSTRYDNQTISFVLTENVNYSQYQNYYFNGQLYELLVEPFTYYTDSEYPTETPSFTPTETPTYPPTLPPTLPPTPRMRCELSSKGFQINSTEPIKCTGNGITYCELPNGSTCSTDQVGSVINCSTKNHSITCYGNNIECHSLDLQCSYHNRTNSNSDNLFVNGIQHHSNIYDHI